MIKQTILQFSEPEQREPRGNRRFERQQLKTGMFKIMFPLIFVLQSWPHARAALFSNKKKNKSIPATAHNINQQLDQSIVYF